MTVLNDDPILDRLRARPHPFAHFRHAITGWLEDKEQRRNRRKTLAALAEMENWQLRDIGVTREEVERLISAAALGR